MGRHGCALLRCMLGDWGHPNSCSIDSHIYFLHSSLFLYLFTFKCYYYNSFILRPRSMDIAKRSYQYWIGIASSLLIWAGAQHFLRDWMCAEQRLRSPYPSAQSDQSHRCPPKDAFDPWLPKECPAKTLIRLCGCTGGPESSLNAHTILYEMQSDWRPGGRGFNPRRGRQYSFVEIDHEIFSTVILSLPLIQEGQLSVSGERMCTILVNRLED